MRARSMRCTAQQRVSLPVDLVDSRAVRQSHSECLRVLCEHSPRLHDRQEIRPTKRTAADPAEWSQQPILSATAQSTVRQQ